MVVTDARAILQCLQSAQKRATDPGCTRPASRRSPICEQDGLSVAFQPSHHCSCRASQITNLCITLNEFPFIRYYVPQNHKPLGPLTPHASIRAPPPQPNSTRWRTNLARGSEARAWESAETDYVTKLLAQMVQQNLDEHRKLDPDFAVGRCITRAIIPSNTS